MDVKKISAEEIMQARHYLPYVEKKQFVEECAINCFDQLAIRAEQRDEIMPLPPMYKENSLARQRYMMAALVKLYLGQHFEAEVGDIWLMSVEDFDYWAGGHPLNQIERMKQKGSAELRDRCFDLLHDFRTLERMFSADLHGMLCAMNDPISRMLAASEASMTPATLQNAMEQMEKIKQGFAEISEQRKGVEENA